VVLLGEAHRADCVAFIRHRIVSSLLARRLVRAVSGRPNFDGFSSARFFGGNFEVMTSVGW